MKNIIGSILLAVVMFTASLADEQAPAATMKVDLATVVNDGQRAAPDRSAYNSSTAKENLTSRVVGETGFLDMGLFAMKCGVL